MIRVAALLALCALPAFAEDRLPALFDVTGVASDDVLNIRSGDGVASEIIGSLTPDATGIEVTARSADGDWGRVNVNERSGWVSMAFLTAHDTDGGLTDIASCFGTEPFWSLDVGPEVVELHGMDGPSEILVFLSQAVASGRADRSAYLGEDEAGAPISLVVAEAACSDGMSDRHYGLTGDLVRSGASGATMLSGCCSVAPGG